MGSFYEFFAGGGMARMGLGQEWSCLFANDFDHKKASVYRQNWKDKALRLGDIRKISVNELPNIPDLVWASFPCQDLSLAGGGAGLKGERSGTFWPFWHLMKGLSEDGRAPSIIVLENVCGTLTSHGGKDFAAICKTLRVGGYRCGAMVIDASHFVPQSRPRLFVIAVRNDVPVPQELHEQPDLLGKTPSSPWRTRALNTAYEKLSESEKENWVWWSLPKPSKRNEVFADLIEEDPASVSWHSAKETKSLIAMMSDVNLAKVEDAKRKNRRMVGAIYKRTRLNEQGFKVQRAEIRFDDVAGCLRTPAGGSSRQLIMVVEGDTVRSRLISTRETARLMGLPDEYELPENYNEAYHLTGDGVVVPVVRHIAEHILEPILDHQSGRTRKAA